MNLEVLCSSPRLKTKRVPTEVNGWLIGETCTAFSNSHMMWSAGASEECGERSPSYAPGFANSFVLIFAFDGIMNCSRNFRIRSFASSDCAYSRVFASAGKVGFATCVSSGPIDTIVAVVVVLRTIFLG